jgi:hypothetical protein
MVVKARKTRWARACDREETSRQRLRGDERATLTLSHNNNCRTFEISDGTNKSPTASGKALVPTPKSDNTKRRIVPFIHASSQK